MPAKKTNKKPSGPRYGKFGNVAKNNPLLMGAPSLSFDNISDEKINELTPEQHADIFFSEWMSEVDPIIRYSRYFSDKKDSLDRFLGMMKRMFLTYCARGDWSEQKFVMVLDHMLENNMTIYGESFEEQGDKFDKEELPFQRRERRMNRGRI